MLRSSAAALVRRLNRDSLLSPTFDYEAISNEWAADAAANVSPKPLAPTHLGGAPRHSMVIVVMDSVRHSTALAKHGDDDVMPFVRARVRAGAEVHEMYTVVPNTNKAVLPLVCGMLPDSSTTWDECAPLLRMRIAASPGTLSASERAATPLQPVPSVQGSAAVRRYARRNLSECLPSVLRANGYRTALFAPGPLEPWANACAKHSDIG